MPICSRARVAVTLLLAAIAVPAGATSYADFALGSLAYLDNDLPEAVRRFDAAHVADPANPTVTRRAFDAALVAGDAVRASAIARTLPTGQGQDGIAALLQLARAFNSRDWRAADRAIDGVAALKLGDALTTIARAWVRYARGDREGALASLNPTTAPAGASALVGEQRARMLAAMGRWAEARTAYAGLVGSGSDSPGTLIAAANAADHAGDRAAAMDLLGSREMVGALWAARVRLREGHPVLARVDGPREGLAATIGAVAGEFARNRAIPAATSFARIASFAAPDDAEVRLLLAELLRSAAQTRAAEAVIAPIESDPLWAGDARGLRARLLIDSDRRDEALALVARAAHGPAASVSDWSLLGELAIEAKTYSQAADAFDHAIAIAQVQGPVGWVQYFQRGSAYEQAKDWPRAEADLRRALALSPRQALVLNYLGYSLVDRNLKVEEGTRLLQKALALAPNNPAILDSLGWAYFRTERYPEAISLLERAAAGEPGDAAIAEHLGDGYWAIGRRLEARFRWNAAVTLDPDAAEKARLLAKIDYGFDRAALAGTKPAA